MKLPLGDLNPGLCPPHLISIYICGVTTAPRVCGGTSPRDGNEAGPKDGIFVPTPHGFFLPHPRPAPPRMMGKISCPIPAP